MEMIASQPNIKAACEPLLFNRDILDDYLVQRRDRYISLNKKESDNLKDYFSKLANGELYHGRTYNNILSKEHSFITNRTVFKILRGNDLIEWFEKNFDGEIIYLIRHPISISLSRIRNKWDNYIDLYLESEYFKGNQLNKSQIKFINSINKTGTKLEKFVLSWCLENYKIYNKVKKKKKYNLISYEELTINTKGISKYLAKKLDLNDWEVMYRTTNNPSAGIKHSTNKIKKSIVKKDKEYLIRRWKEEVGDKEEKQCFDILNEFNIDLYEYGNFMPVDKYIISDYI